MVFIIILFQQRVSDEVSGCLDLDVKVIEKSQTLTTDLHEAVKVVSSETETVKVIHEDVMKCEHVKEDRLQDSEENIRSEVVKVIFNVTEDAMTSNAVQESANHKAVERLENALEITTQLKDVAEVIRPENAKITHLIDVMDIIEPEEVKIKSMVVVIDTVNEISNHRDVVEVRRPTELGTVDLAKEVEFTGSDSRHVEVKVHVADCADCVSVSALSPVCFQSLRSASVPSSCSHASL